MTQFEATVRLPLLAEVHHAVWWHVFVRQTLAPRLHPDPMSDINLSMSVGVSIGLSVGAGHLNEQVVRFALTTYVIMSVRWHFSHRQLVLLLATFRA